MKPTMNQSEKLELVALESRAPEAGRLVSMWRTAVEKVARAHVTHQRMRPGPNRDKLGVRLKEFESLRRDVSRQASQEISRHEGGVHDFETMTGTATLTTDPSMPSTGIRSQELNLGLHPVLWIIFVAGGIGAAYKASDLIVTKTIEWANIIFWGTIVMGGGWGLYKLMRSGKSRRARFQHRYVGETY